MFIPALTEPVVKSGYASVVLQSSRILAHERYSTSPVVGDKVEYVVPLDAGTWTLTIVHTQANNNGTVAVSIDGVSVQTIDGYNASTGSTIATITGIAIAEAGTHRLKVEVTGKNASSASYYFALSGFSFTKTA